MTKLNDFRRDPKALTIVFGSAAAMILSSFLYKYTLRAWFQEDDFAWLGLSLQVHTWNDFLHTMFAPMAQGTIRPFSERAFYMAFFEMFGLNALPYRILVYVTQLANIGLFSAVAYRLTKSPASSFWAPVLWISNSVLALPMTWTATYNEILCSFIFLLSFYGLIRFVETGNRRFELLQWGSFLFGFGVLEINVLYPAVAILYVLLFHRSYLGRTALLIAPSVLFSAIHFAVRIQPRSNIYDMHVDASMIGTLWQYWKLALGPAVAARTFPRLHFAPAVLTFVITVALLGFAAWRTSRGDRLPVFCLGWFVIMLAPFLPIRNHISDYYLTVPCIGLALLGSWAIVLAWNQKWPYRIAAIGVTATYLLCSIPAARASSRYTWSQSVPVKKLVLGIEKIHDDNPGKRILLEGVDATLFWNGVYDRPFRLFDAEVYVTPDTVQKVPPAPELGNVADYTLSAQEIRSALEQNRMLVYGLGTGELRDITRVYQDSMLQIALPLRIDMGKPPTEALLGPSWYPPEGDFRWMPKTATVRLGVPPQGRGAIHVEAYCVPIQVQSAPLQAWVIANGLKSAPLEIRDCNQAVNLSLPFTVSNGKKEIEVNVEVDRTITVPGDPRTLGLAVRTIEIVVPK